MSDLTPKKEFLFRKENYRFLLLSMTLIAIGFILMAGGGSEDPNFFNPEIFNFRRSIFFKIIKTCIFIFYIFIKS